MAGSARIANHRVSPLLSSTRYSSSNGSLLATAPSIKVRTRSRSSGCTTARWAVEGAFEFERINAVHPMQFIAPLDRVRADIPQPSTDVGERLPLAEPLFDLGKRGLSQPCLGELLCHADCADVLAGCLDDGRHRQGDRHGHSVFALDLRDHTIDPLTCCDTPCDRLQITAQMWRSERCQSVADDLLLRVTEDPFCATIPTHDASVSVLAEQCESPQIAEKRCCGDALDRIPHCSRTLPHPLVRAGRKAYCPARWSISASQSPSLR